MTAMWNFERTIRLLSGRTRRAVPTRREVRFRPGVEAIEGRTLLSSFAGSNSLENVAGPPTLAVINTDRAVESGILANIGRGAQTVGQPDNTPGPSFVGDFDGKTDLLTVNPSSNDLTLISGYGGPKPVTTTISSAGVDPRMALTFTTPNGFDNLVLANTGDGVLTLFEGTSKGLVLVSSVTSGDLRHATALEFLGISGHDVRLFVLRGNQTAGEVEVLSLTGGNILSGQPGPNSTGSSGIAQLVPLQESSLALIGTLLPVTPDAPASAPSYAVEAMAAPTLESSTPGSLGQPLLARAIRFAEARAGNEAPIKIADGPVVPGGKSGAAWQQYVLGTDEALNQFDREHPDLSRDGSQDVPVTRSGDGRSDADKAVTAVMALPESPFSTANQVAIAATTDQAIDLLGGHDPVVGGQTWWREETTVEAGFRSRLAATRGRLSACLFITTVGAGCLYLRPASRRGRANGRRIEARRRQTT